MMIIKMKPYCCHQIKIKQSFLRIMNTSYYCSRVCTRGGACTRVQCVFLLDAHLFYNYFILCFFAAIYTAANNLNVKPNPNSTQLIPNCPTQSRTITTNEIIHFVQNKCKKKYTCIKNNTSAVTFADACAECIMQSRY